MSKERKLSEYQVPDFLMRHVELHVDLTKDPVESNATLSIEPNPLSSSNATELHLDFENMELFSILVEGELLSEEKYELKDNVLIIKEIPQGKAFKVQTKTNLGENTDLFGLYETEQTVLVKAETEGLRRVFPCIDRPDVQSTYTVTITADKEKYPTLLANGILTEEKDLGKGIHSATWTNVLAIPSYLFALVAGKLTCSESTYTTKLGTPLPIKFYVPEDALEKIPFAMDVLKAAMLWDEHRFDLPCFLPEFKVAGVYQYASGASECMGLNLFNTANLFASLASRTYVDIMRVMEVVAHEYFHTWTGNYVTIRDWFNLPFKEGLTTFRASLFLEYLLGIDPERLANGAKFDERAPRPAAYTAVRSLYTNAAYEKSSEIFRMVMNTVGEQAFNKALSDFLANNMGKETTLEQFLNDLSESCKKDVRPYLSWFTESGIPKVHVHDEYDEQSKTYKLKFKTEGAKNRPIPVAFALFDRNGKELVPSTTHTLNGQEVELEFPNIQEKPTPSLLRGLSAPVNLEFNYTEEQLLFLMRHENDAYAQCSAAKELITQMVRDYCQEKPIEFSSEFIVTYLSLLSNTQLNKWVLAELLSFPSEEALIASLPAVGFEKIADARRFIQTKLAQELKEDLETCIANTDTKEMSNQLIFDITAAGKCRIKSICYAYLQTIEPEKTEHALIKQFKESLGHNMTETISALTLLLNGNSKQQADLLEEFYQHWIKDANAINYWFSLQASAHSPTVVENVDLLLDDDAFDLANPNRVNALIGSFIKNPYGFHAISGDGYKLVANVILKLEEINPTVAANLTEKFNDWDKYDQTRQKLMLSSLRELASKATTAEVRNSAKKGLEKAKVNLPSQATPNLAALINWGYFGEQEKSARATPSAKKGEQPSNNTTPRF